MLGHVVNSSETNSENKTTLIVEYNLSAPAIVWHSFIPSDSREMQESQKNTLCLLHIVTDIRRQEL